MKYDVIAAHKFCSDHKSELERDKVCGCFYCKRIFDPAEIQEWIFFDESPDERGTALCPYCGIDSIIGESSGYPITQDFLDAMHKHWFGGGD